MIDDDVDPSGGGEGSAPGGSGSAAPGGTSGADVSFEQAIADFDAQAQVDYQAGDAAPQRVSTTGDGDGAPAVPRDRIGKLIQDNYGGDEDAFVASFFESRKEGKRLSDELAVLRHRIDNPPAPPPAARDRVAELKNALAASPEVAAVNQEYQSIEAQNARLTTRQMQLADEAEKVGREVAKAQGELTYAFEEKRPEIITRLQEGRMRMAEIRGEFNNNEAELKGNKSQLRTLQREWRSLENSIKAQMDQEEQAAADTQAEQERTMGAFHGSFERVAKEFGLEDGSSRHRLFRNAVKETLAQYCDRLAATGQGDGLDSYGIHEAVQIISERMAREFNLAKPAARRAPRPPTPRPISPLPNRGQAPQRFAEPSNASASPGQDPLDDPAFVRKRASFVAEQLARASQGARGLA